MPGSPDNSAAADVQAAEYVYYEFADYAGFWRRLASEIVDLAGLCLLLCLFLAACALCGLRLEENEPLPSWLCLSLAAISYLYLTVLKRSRLRTPGYWATGVRIVSLKGNPPSLWAMTLRLFWWVLGPINALLDLLFMSGDDRRQTVRDKIVGTYVIRKNARPAGLGRKTYGRLTFMGLFFVHPQVTPIASAGKTAEQ